MRFARAAFVSTMAAAPSEEGHTSRKWMGSQIIGLAFTASIVMSA